MTSSSLGWGPVPRDRLRSQDPSGARDFLRLVLHRGCGECRFRQRDRLGAGSLSLSGAPCGQCGCRSAVRLADGGAGISLVAIYTQDGPVGRLLAPLGIKVAFTPLGIVVALIFIGLPFVVRTVQPVIEESEPEIEETAATLGASRLQTMLRVILPTLAPALLTGFVRAVGEYGSVIFIADNIPYVSEIAALLIVIRLEKFDYAAATAIASIMLLLSFAMLLIINLIQS